jgi:hypothetical protein
VGAWGVRAAGSSCDAALSLPFRWHSTLKRFMGRPQPCACALAGSLAWLDNIAICARATGVEVT